MKISVEKIVSGGQTGADRAALDWAIEHHVAHGGWCPDGRKAEDGVIPERYLLDELPGGGYRQRTKANVRDSDGTLVVSIEAKLSGGSLATTEFAFQLKKPWLHVSPSSGWESQLSQWISKNSLRVLNVAGPRASKEPAVAAFTKEVLDELFRQK
jgi:hypothetical protein